MCDFCPWLLGQKLVYLFSPTFLDLPKRGLKTYFTFVYAMTNSLSTGNPITISSVNSSYVCVLLFSSTLM